MRARVLFSFVGAVIAAVALVSSSGAATAKTQKVTRIDVSTRAAVIHYLRSIHVKAKGAVIQRGALNYAGAHCPGSRWTCASTRHTVVQIAKRGGQNRFVCRSASCTVVQLTGVSHGVYLGRQLAKGGGGGGSSGVCIKTTGLTQSCTISQSGVGPNSAVVYESAGNQSGLTQTASYTATITQVATGTAATSGNTACVTQSVSLTGSTTAKKGVPVTVTLEAHQSVTIRQDVAGQGTNNAAQAATYDGTTAGCQPLSLSSSINQSQTLNSIANGSGSITQNEDDQFIACGDGVTGDYGNLCLDIEQNQASGNGVASGPNNANFTQTSAQQAVANTPAGPVTQTQSSTCTNNPNAPANCVMPGGLVGTLNQDSSGMSTASVTQNETQCEDAATSGLTTCTTGPADHDFNGSYSLTQNQYGPEGVWKFHNNRGKRRHLFKTLKGLFGTSTQTRNNQDSFTIMQTTQQDNDQGPGSNQTNTVQADCQTSGNCTATQNTNVDGQASTNVASGSTVSTSTNCSGSTCTGTPPPTPSIDSKPPNPDSFSTATFSFSDTNTSATFLCDIDGLGFSACTSPKTYTGLADGSHTFSVEATQNGNTSAAATYTWTIATGTPITVQQLNPASDPSGGSCAFGYASGTGFQGTPQQVHDSVDLSQYDGKAIQLRFSFSTGDALYNAFEGWYVKNIQVTGTQSNNPVTVFSDNPVVDGDTSFTASSTFGTAPGWHVTDRFGAPVWWYGDETTGTYQSPNPVDGCTDSSANAGTITTPVFTLASNSQLSFDTLWQIESVNPSGFDLMDIQVIPR
jgi:hypothetical protein